jgi:hemoglobin
MTATPARSCFLLAIAILAALALAGCAGGDRENEVPSSGDPEADRRADVRVDADSTKKDSAPKTLYERIGGEKVITAIVDDMTTRVLADPRLNFTRKDVKTGWLGGKYEPWVPTYTNTQHFKARMVEFLTLAAGGPVEYRGRDLRETHKGMKISNNEFDSMVGDIKTSMDKLGIAAREKRDLLAIVETTRKQIVEE